MNGKTRPAASMAVVLLAALACNLPVAGNAPFSLDEQPAEVTPPTLTRAPATSDMPPSTQAPTDTPPPTLTPSETATFTPSVVTLDVSGNTNCRTGPGMVYDLLDALLVGQTAEVVGRDAAGENWVIKPPSNPARTCWLWGRYATVSGNWQALPIVEPPPTPTPSPSFTFSYDFWGVGPGYQCFRFDVKNTGLVAWESFSLTLHNGAHGTNEAGSSNEFVGYDDWCGSTGSQAKLIPGALGTASVTTHLAYNPAGETFTASLKLCSENGLGGTCKSKTIDFTP